MDTAAIIAAVGVAAALFTFVKALFEYSKQNRQKRAEHFSYLRRRLKDNPSFSHICELLEYDDSELRTTPYAQKRDFLGFFQELAILVNSKLVRIEVAHYMFGYYALRCWNSSHFWRNEEGQWMNKEDRHWRLFDHFAKRLEAIEKNFKGTDTEMKRLRL
jgi:hypothetical protein